MTIGGLPAGLLEADGLLPLLLLLLLLLLLWWAPLLPIRIGWPGDEPRERPEDGDGV